MLLIGIVLFILMPDILAVFGVHGLQHDLLGNGGVPFIIFALVVGLWTIISGVGFFQAITSKQAAYCKQVAIKQTAKQMQPQGYNRFV